MRSLLLLTVCAALTACVRDNSDARLDATDGIDTRERAALLTLDCTQKRDEAVAARDEGQSDGERVASYQLAIKAFDASAAKIEAAFTRDPDLLYAAEGDALRLRQQRCVSQGKAFTDELRKFQLMVELRGPPKEKEEVSAPPPPPVKKVKKAKPSKVAKKKRVAPRQSAVLATR